jgi:hypothetical protein
MNSDHQKFDINIGDISVNVDPPVIHTIVRMVDSISELQVPIFAVCYIERMYDFLDDHTR